MTFARWFELELPWGRLWDEDLDTMSVTDVIALVPCAGHATRLKGLPCSKEIFPLGFAADAVDGSPQSRAVCLHLLSCLREAGVRRAYVLLRQGKWDIPAYLGDGTAVGLDLAYRVLEPTAGVADTLDRAYPFVQDSLVALGFPDTLFQPEDAYVHLLARQRESGADIVLGLFPTDRPEKVDMVVLDDAGRVTDIVIKEPNCDLSYCWCIAVWTPAFTRYLHAFLKRPEARGAAAAGEEIYPGHVIRAAMREGMGVEAVAFPTGEFLDVGSPGDLMRATQRFLATEPGRPR